MGFGRTAAQASLRGGSALGKSLWKKLTRYAALIPFANELVAAYYCALDRETPHVARGVLIAAVAYFVLPTDSIPDIIPALGFTDDAAVLAAAIKFVSGHIKPEHREAAEMRLARIRRFTGAE